MWAQKQKKNPHQCWINKVSILYTRIFFDAHENSISVAFNAIENFTLHSCSLDFMISLAAKLATIYKHLKTHVAVVQCLNRQGGVG